ncbi:22_t:CDS:1, partial [Cetraspora pellucida]
SQSSQRHSLNDNIKGDSSSPSSLLFSSLPDKRYPKTDENLNLMMSSVDQSPFPAHLSQSKFEHKSNRETSRKLQLQRSTLPPHPPPLGPLPATPILSTPPSNLIPSPDEEYDQQLKIIDESNSIQQIPSSPPPLLSPRSQKLGILGGLFNKQSSGSQLNPSGIPNISPPIPLSLPLQSTNQQFMLYPRPPSPPINSPPQSPPLSPSRAVRLPTPRVKTRRANDVTPTIQDPEKLRKMEQFEALIASTEAQNSKKSKTGKIRALTTAIIPTTSSSSSSTP